MKKTGAWLVRYALEQLGVRQTFGIPGVHNTELYDELNSSGQIEPILVSHEVGAAFMADAVSRTSKQIGCLAIVPAAGVTHASSGIGEAFLDGVPMLVISGGIRSDSDYGYQLHEVDQHALLKPITKATYFIENHNDIVSTIYDAYRLAVSGEPGPVFIEIPVNIQLDKGHIDQLIEFVPAAKETLQSELDVLLSEAAALLSEAKKPGIFIGWGARHASADIAAIAEHISAPVATTLQGLSSFPADHPLHTGFGFGPAAIPASYEAFKECDCLLAVGTRFAEIATGSYGVSVPENLIHIDINPKVFSRNFPAKVAIEGDAQLVVAALAKLLTQETEPRDSSVLESAIARNKETYRNEWRDYQSAERVNPIVLFDHLRIALEDDGIVVLDDGNHTFLAAELMPIHQGGQLISPTDFNCMGYAVPATIGAKLVNPTKQVVSIVGDGAFNMTCMELATAVKLQLGMVLFIFNDGELSQIAQAQERPYNRTTCTALPSIDYKALAQALSCDYVAIRTNDEVESGVVQAMSKAEQNRPVIVNVMVDYSKSTRFTDGVVKTNIKRLPTNTKVRMVGRAIYRKIRKPN